VCSRSSFQVRMIESDNNPNNNTIYRPVGESEREHVISKRFWKSDVS